MKTNREFKFPYFLVGIALGAISALFLAPSPAKKLGNIFVSEVTTAWII